MSKNTDRTFNSVLNATLIFWFDSLNRRRWVVYFSYPAYQLNLHNKLLVCFRVTPLSNCFRRNKIVPFTTTFCFQSFVERVIWTAMEIFLDNVLVFLFFGVHLLVWPSQVVFGTKFIFFQHTHLQLLSIKTFRCWCLENLSNRFAIAIFWDVFCLSCLLNIPDFCGFPHISFLNSLSRIVMGITFRVGI